MNIRIVTTHNPAHWTTYARHNLESMLDFLPYEVVSYHEGTRPALEHDRLVWRELWEVPGAEEFVDEAATFPPACGHFDGIKSDRCLPGSRLASAKYDYNFDAHKFARKVYAQCDAAEEPCDVLIWLDSDVEVLAPLSESRIEDTLGGMAMACYQRHGYHTETGIVFWDMRQEITARFFRHYRYLYDSRRVYTLAHGWHDCWALDAVSNVLAIPSTNLSRHPQRMDVVSSSALADVFRHDKGNRKYVAA